VLELFLGAEVVSLGCGIGGLGYSEPIFCLIQVVQVGSIFSQEIFWLFVSSLKIFEVNYPEFV
jgi:hypothetical protein